MPHPFYRRAGKIDLLENVRTPVHGHNRPSWKSRGTRVDALTNWYHLHEFAPTSRHRAKGHAVETRYVRRPSSQAEL